MLHATRKRSDIKYLIVTGCTTSICVESTIRDAMVRDYSCVLLKDCAGEPIGHDLPRSNHDASLLTSDFVTVPYTFHLNDIVSFPFSGWNPMAYEQALKDEFDQLYGEGVRRRRMMVISLHDRISGHAGRVRVLDRFLEYARSKQSVWFARKDEIARFARDNRAKTPVLDRGPAGRTGCRVPRLDTIKRNDHGRLSQRPEMVVAAAGCRPQ